MPSRSVWFFAFLLLVAWAAVVLNHPSYLIERTMFVHRVADPSLMLIGLIGSIFRIRVLRVFGWIGILWFIPVILYSVPDLEHADPALRGFPSFWRLGTTLLLSLMLVVVFWLLPIRRSRSAGRFD